MTNRNTKIPLMVPRNYLIINLIVSTEIRNNSVNSSFLFLNKIQRHINVIKQLEHNLFCSDKEKAN